MPSQPIAARRELPSVDGFCHLCQLPVLDVAEHVYENGMYHQAATKIAAVALDRWRAHMDASSVTEVPDAAENVTFCDVCTEAVPSASYIRHVTARPHLMAALDDKYFEELVKEYIDDEDLELLEDPPVVSGEETSEKSDAKTAYECHICAVQVPSPFVLQHERSFHHRTRVALSTAAARRTSAFLHNRTPKGVKLKSDIKITKLLELYTGTDFAANEEKDVPEKVSQVDITKRLTAKQYFSDIMPFLHFTETLYTIIVDDTEYVTIRNSNGTYMRVHVASFNGVESTSAGEHYDLRCKMCDGTNKNITYSSKKGHDKLHVTSLGHIRQLLTPIDNAHGIRKLGDMLALCVVCDTLMKENGIENHIFNNMHHTAALAEALKLGEKFKEGKDDLKIIIYTAAPYFKTIYNKNNGNIFSQEDFGGAVSLPQGSLVPKPQSSLFGIPNFYPAVSKLSTGTLFGSAPASTAKADSGAASTAKLGSVPATTVKLGSAAATTAKVGSPASTAKLGSPASTAKVDSAAASTAKLVSPASTAKVDSAAASTAKLGSVHASPGKLGSAPLSTVKLGSAPLSTAKVDSAAASTAKFDSPASTAKLGSAPASTPKVDSATVSTAKVDSVPSSTAKLSSAAASIFKVDSAPASTAKVDSAPVSTAKVDSAPTSTVKLGSAPASITKVDSAPASIAKVDSVPASTAKLGSPASTAKVDSAAASTAKLDSVPTGTAKLDSAPVSTAKRDSVPAGTAKLDSAPASTAKLDSTPASTAKLDSVPAGTAKLDSAPASTAKLDSTPTSTAKPDSAPASTASLGSASKTVTNIMFLPGVTHECSMGMLIIDEKGEASFTAKDKNGEHISKIVEAGVSGHKLAKVLNQDLRELTNYLILNPNLFNDYRKLEVKEQQDILEKLISNSSCKTGQWSIITTVD